MMTRLVFCIFSSLILACGMPPVQIPKISRDQPAVRTFSEHDCQISPIWLKTEENMFALCGGGIVNLSGEELEMETQGMCLVARPTFSLGYALVARRSSVFCTMSESGGRLDTVGVYFKADGYQLCWDNSCTDEYPHQSKIRHADLDP